MVFLGGQEAPLASHATKMGLATLVATHCCQAGAGIAGMGLPSRWQWLNTPVVARGPGISLAVFAAIECIGTALALSAGL